MTATHAYVVTSSLYVHNLLNQVRDDDSIMNDAVWLPKANDYESDSKSWMMIGHLWIHVASTFKNVKVIVDVKVVFVVNIVIVVKRNLMFFFQWSSTLYVIRTLSYFTLIAERRLGLTMMSI